MDPCMNQIFKNLSLVLISFTLCFTSFGMDEGILKAGHGRPSSKEKNQRKRQKVDCSILSGSESDFDQNPVEEEEEALKSHLARQAKVTYFQDFREKMEKKFCYAGSGVGKILDKLAALYLDWPSDKPGVFVIGATTGVGKNTLAKHIRDFLESDPFLDSGTANGRFQLIKDRNKRILGDEILKNTGSSVRLKKGIHKVVVIDEIQAMLKDNGAYNAVNELWFHAFGDAEINIDIAGTLNMKKAFIVNAIKRHFGIKTQLNSLNLEIIKLQDKLDEAKKKEPNDGIAISSTIGTLERKKEESQAALCSIVTDLTVELRQLMSEIPSFFSDDEKLKSTEILAHSFLDSDVATIERRFSDMPSYKNLYFERNIYIFLGNPAKTNDEIRDEMKLSPVQTRETLRALAKKKLSEETVRSWFISHALTGPYYNLNQCGWDSRIQHVFAICPPASKHLPSLISASIEGDFCIGLSDKLHVADEVLDFFLLELKDPTKDLRSLSCCYSPILTKMFTSLRLKLGASHEPHFRLEKQEDELVLMLEADRNIEVRHEIKTKKPKKEEQIIKAQPSLEDERDRQRKAIYSAYFYAFYHSFFTQLPAQLSRVGDAKFDEFYEDCTPEFNLTKELSMLSLNLVLKYVGLVHFAGETDRVFKKERAMDSLLNILEYIKELKNTHSNKEIYLIINKALNKVNSNFSSFFRNSGMFEFINTKLIDRPFSMAVEGDEEQNDGAQNTPPNLEEIADSIYEILINFDNSAQGFNATVERITQTEPFQQMFRGFYGEFLKSKKLIVSFDGSGNPNQIRAAESQ